MNDQKTVNAIMLNVQRMNLQVVEALKAMIDALETRISDQDDRIHELEYGLARQYEDFREQLELRDS